MTIKDLLPRGTTLITHWMPWFGASGHRDVGYKSENPDTIRRQLEQMDSYGIDGVNVDWYGTQNGSTSMHHNLATLRMFAECERMKKTFSICIDDGIVPAAVRAKAVAGDQVSQKVVQVAYSIALAYVRDTFCLSDVYLRWNNRPVVFFFDATLPFLDWSEIRSTFTSAVFVFRKSGGFTRTESDGAFGWIADPESKDSSGSQLWERPEDPGLRYLFKFYDAAAKNSGKLAIGSIYPGFDNDNPKDPGWSVWDGGAHTKPSRKIFRREGLTLLDTISVVPRTGVPIVMANTWNDIEEGSDLERGLGSMVEAVIGRSA